MKKLMMVLLGAGGLFIVASFSVVSLHLFELNQLLRADMQVGFVKLIEKEEVQDKVMSVLYSNLKADYCGIKAAQQQLVFKYTLAEDFKSKLNEIEVLFTTTLKSLHQSDPLDCIDSA